jgi:hypothetical protein
MTISRAVIRSVVPVGHFVFAFAEKECCQEPRSREDIFSLPPDRITIDQRVTLQV